MTKAGVKSPRRKASLGAERKQLVTCMAACSESAGPDATISLPDDVVTYLETLRDLQNRPSSIQLSAW